ncbi:MAG: hypothetical protein EPO27_03860 [Betaproteobacteria bacterium]|nr:MAG: hypothetical protein EPO27_03860 [Betaproteobacteria bacterium]
MAEAKLASIQRHHTLQQLAWDEINEPGAYVEVATGTLYRVPKEGLLVGASPLIRKQSTVESPFIQVSKNPFVLELEARMICAEHNIQPNF